MNIKEVIVLDRYIGYKIISDEDNKSAVKQILDVIISYFKVNKAFTLNKVILFGSRSRKDYRWDSDFDIVVIVDENISVEEKYIIQDEILDKISKNRYKGEILDVELIVSGLKNFAEATNYFGHILRYAHKEGIVLYGKVLQSGKKVA